jgi:hypothetical protein
MFFPNGNPPVRISRLGTKRILGVLPADEGATRTHAVRLRAECRARGFEVISVKKDSLPGTAGVPPARA